MSARRLVIALVGLVAALVLGSAAAGQSFSLLDRTQAKALSDPAQHSAPTIVALWSSVCTHCKANLQRFAAMAKQHRGLRVITVATETVAEGLGEPLDKAGLRGKRYAYGDDNPDALAFALDPKWRGELPRTLFFDGRGGKEARSGVIDVSDARSALGLGR